jgi:lysophospholipase L1-like esterase
MHTFTRRAVLGMAAAAFIGCRRHITPVARTNQVIFSGDSITLATGQGISTSDRYAGLVATQLPEIAANDSVIAVGSTSIGSDGGQGAAADSAYDASKAVNILTVLFGANDMLTLTGAEFYAALKVWCEARQSTGFKVVVLTTLNHTTGGGIASRRNAANALIRADASFYDALADIASDPIMGTDAAPSDTDLYLDGVHPTVLGHTYLAPYVRNAISSLILSSAGRNM